MMLDKDNMFFFRKDITTNTNSDVVYNGGAGNAYVAPWLVNDKAGTEIVTRLGQGAKEYIRINANNMTAGAISAFLVFDANTI